MILINQGNYKGTKQFPLKLSDQRGLRIEKGYNNYGAP